MYVRHFHLACSLIASSRTLQSMLSGRSVGRVRKVQGGGGVERGSEEGGRGELFRLYIHLPVGISLGAARSLELPRVAHFFFLLKRRKEKRRETTFRQYIDLPVGISLGAARSLELPRVAHFFFLLLF